MHRKLEEARASYLADGYIHLPGVFEAGEIAPLAELVCEPACDRFFTVGPLDYIGWTAPGDDWVGVCARLERVVDLAETLIGVPCYHYHSKIVRKPPGREAALAWHQDYGSWYKDGCISPDMLTVVVALTPATKDNGCLRVLPGSHRIGRLERVPAGHESYTYFDLNPARLRAIKSRHEEHAVVMVPGDVLVFHANTLHASGPNTSVGPRVLLEMSYNAIGNSPVFDHQAHHAAAFIERADDRALREGRYQGVFGRTRLVDIDDPGDPAVGIFRRSRDIGLC